jgi:hypothetical protein
MRYVCPRLEVWMDIYEKTKCIVPGSPPPCPPTPDQWAASTDEEKSTKWELTMTWLEEYDLDHYFQPGEGDWYVTAVQYINRGNGTANPFPYGKDPLLNKN